MKAEDLIKNNSLTNIEVTEGQTVVFTEIALTAMNMAHEEGAKWQAEQSPWISVNERLPDNDDDLYFVLDAKLEPPACGVCDFDLDMHKWVGAGGIISHPTHWMPIPKFNV